jgi:NAD(P)-dependent dehydrogenase (short-subunit alcohol dehydrogenase family)
MTGELVRLLDASGLGYAARQVRQIGRRAAELPAMDDLFDLSGKIAVITGGSRGLGLQMVRAFAARGADVVIASRKLDACEAAAVEVEAMGRRALPISVNASDWAQMDRLAEAAYDHFGRVDILVNNAGMSPAMPSHEMTEAWFDKIVSLNFKGPFRLAAQVAKRMADGDGGAIINVSSSGALVPLPMVVAYSGAKAALNAMTVSLAREYGPKVRVNAISAGPFLTDISKAWSEEARQRSGNSLGRPGRPEEIVTTALYLASPASSFTTGAVVRCDGGQS